MTRRNAKHPYRSVQGRDLAGILGTVLWLLQVALLSVPFWYATPGLIWQYPVLYVLALLIGQLTYDSLLLATVEIRRLRESDSILLGFFLGVAHFVGVGVFEALAIVSTSWPVPGVSQVRSLSRNDLVYRVAFPGTTHYETFDCPYESLKGYLATPGGARISSLIRYLATNLRLFHRVFGPS
jgi:hypothetical protein